MEIRSLSPKIGKVIGATGCPTCKVGAELVFLKGAFMELPTEESWRTARRDVPVFQMDISKVEASRVKPYQLRQVLLKAVSLEILKKGWKKGDDLFIEDFPSFFQLVPRKETKSLIEESRKILDYNCWVVSFEDFWKNPQKIINELPGRP